MTTSDYRPIDCDMHSMLEQLALQRSAVTVRAVDEHQAAIVIEGTVSDVYTRDRAEYLELRDAAGDIFAVRLDRLRAIYDAAGVQIWRQ